MVRLLRSGLALLALSMFAAVARSDEPQAKTRLDCLEGEFEDLRSTLKISGMPVAVVQDQRLLWAKSLRFADLEQRQPATENTLYHVASLAKPFAATLAPQMGRGQVGGGEKEAAFDYYQVGQTGRGLCRVLTLDLGDGVTMELVRIPAGTFQMGSPLVEKERRVDEEQHRVEITRDFYLGKYEVTRGQFRAFVKDTGYRTEPETDGQGGWGYDEDTGKIEGRKPKYTWKSTGFAQTDEHPVVNVTWNDANAFCRWLAQRTKKSVRLPTEAEWEYACRAGSATRFYSGEDAETLAKVGNVADGTAKKKFPDWQSTIATEDDYVFTAPVGQFRANRFGLYDMHGNVWEWCQDWLGPYGDLGAKDPVRDNQDKGVRVMRGGSWGKRIPQICSSALRFSGAPPSRDLDVGFRVSIRLD